MCGNTRCERGEECTDPRCTFGCLRDCPAYQGTCPVGINTQGYQTVCSSVGTCVAAAATCVCNTGYAGNACEECAVDFVWGVDPEDLSRVCVGLPGVLVSCDDGRRDGNEEGVDCGGPNCAPCVAVRIAYGTSAGRWQAVGIVVGCVALVVLVVLVLLLRQRLCRWDKRVNARVKGAGRHVPASVTRSVQVVPAPQSPSSNAAPIRTRPLAGQGLKTAGRKGRGVQTQGSFTQYGVEVVEWGGGDEWLSASRVLGSAAKLQHDS